MNAAFGPQLEQRPGSASPSADVQPYMLVGLRRSLASGNTNWNAIDDSWKIGIYGVIEKRPKMVEGEVLGDTMTLEFDLPLDETSVPDGEDFTVNWGTEDETSSNDASEASVSGSTVTLDLLQAVSYSDTLVKVSYDATASDPLRSLRGIPVASISFRQVTNITPTPPVFQSATVLGDVLMVTFDKALDRTSLPAGSAFSVAGEHTATATGTAAISGSTVTVTLDSAADRDDTVTVSYTVPSTGNKLRDAVGKQFSEVLAFSGKAVDNIRPAPPAFVSASVDRLELTINFDAPLDPVSRPAGTVFTVTGGGGGTGTGTVAVSGNAVTVTLDSAIAQADDLKVAYDKPSESPLRHAIGKKFAEVESFANKPVTYGTAPVITSVTIAFVPTVDADGDGTPDTYGSGEQIFVDVQFDEAVTVDTQGMSDGAYVWLDMAANNALRLDENRRAVPFLGLGRGDLIVRFAYTVQATDRDADGVFVQPRPATTGLCFWRSRRRSVVQARKSMPSCRSPG